MPGYTATLNVAAVAVTVVHTYEQLRAVLNRDLGQLEAQGIAVKDLRVDLHVLPADGPTIDTPPEPLTR